MKAIGCFVSFVVIGIISTLFSGYALSMLWSWFVVGAFGLPQLTINTAIGLALIVSYMTKSVDRDNEKSIGELLWKCLFVGLVKPSTALVIGWIVHLFA